MTTLDTTPMLSDFKRRAAEDRCGLRRIFEQASQRLEPLELVRLAEHLEQIKPCSVIDKGGHRRQVEERFKLRPKDRRALAVDLFQSGVAEHRIANLAGMPDRTWRRLRANHGAATPENGSLRRMDKREKRPFRGAPVGSQPRAYLDASSGADIEAEREFHRRLAA